MIDLKKLKEVGEKATEGPWQEGEDGWDVLHKECKDVDCQDYDCVDHVSDPFLSQEDFDFVIEARNNWDAIIKEIETLREAKKEAEEMFKVMADMEPQTKTYSWNKWLEKYGSEDE